MFQKKLFSEGVSQLQKLYNYHDSSICCKTQQRVTAWKLFEPCLHKLESGKY